MDTPRGSSPTLRDLNLAAVREPLPREARALMGRKTALPMPVPLRAKYRHTQDNFILVCCADDCGLGGAEED